MSGILETYRSIYQLDHSFPIVTLHEGSTPLIPAQNLPTFLEKTTGIQDLKIWFKYEGLNPTGSFKDRGMTYAISQALHEGASHVICASTGNTSASAAAYAARCGLSAIILIPKGKVALGKLSQAMLYGANIIEIDGNFDQALQIVRELGKTGRVTVVNSINPYRILGQQSAAFEIIDALSEAPDYHFIPVGNAGNITAYWQGYTQYHQHGKSEQRPKMMGYEAEGSAAIAKGQVIEQPETFATAIRIGNPASWEGATTARDESGGVIDWVNDKDIAAAYTYLGNQEGIFCEPASAASVAGLIKACQEALVAKSSRIVCTLTGNGLKDPDSAIELGHGSKASLPADTQVILEHLKLSE